MDLESLSDSELEAIASGNLDSLPDSTLELLASSPAESSPWNLGDAIKQFLSGAVENIAGLPATVYDLNPLGMTQPWRLGADLNFTASKQVQETLDPYLSARDPNYRYSRTIGGFVGPGLFGKGLKVIKAAPEAITFAANTLAPESGVVRQLGTDIVGGAGSQGLQDLTGEQPISGLVGAAGGAGLFSAGRDVLSGLRSLFTGATKQEIKGSASKILQDISGLSPKQLAEAAGSQPPDAMGSLMTSAELTKNAGLAQLEKQLGGLPQNSTSYAQRAAQREGVRNDILDSMSTVEGVNKEGLGTKLMTTAAKNQDEMQKVTGEVWQQFPRNEPIDISPEQEILAEILQSKQAGLPLDSKVRTLVGQFLDSKNKGVQTSGALQDIRSDALDTLRSQGNLTGNERRILAVLQSSIDNAMEHGLSEDAFAIWKAGREATKVTAETFKKGTAGGSLTEPTARPSNALSNAFKGDSQSIKQLKVAIGEDPALMEEVKRGILDQVPRDMQGRLTTNNMKKYIAANKGGIQTLFGDEGLGNFDRILEDLRSEGDVQNLASWASRGNSVTAQKQTVAGALQELFASNVTGALGPIGTVIEVLKKFAGINDKAALEDMLFKAAMEPDFLAELAKTPTKTRIFSAAKRLADLAGNATRGAGRAGLFSISGRNSQQAKGQEKQAGYNLNGGSNNGLSKPPNSGQGHIQKEENKGTYGNQNGGGDYSSGNYQNLSQGAILQPSFYSPAASDQAAFDSLGLNSYGSEDMDVDALVRAVIGQESGGNSRAVSPKGAQGLMQIMPGTARQIAYELGYDTYDLHDPTTNEIFGRYYLQQQLDRFGDPALALAAYNAGPSRVASWIEKYGSDWDAISRELAKRKMYLETVRYVPSVLARLDTLTGVSQA